MMAALVYRCDGTPDKLSFEIIQKSYTTELIRRWCHRLIRAMNGKPAYLIWDRLPAHRNKSIVALLAAHRIEVILLPPYAPDLNPTEWLWAHLKRCELANYCPEDLCAVGHEARRAMRRVKKRLSLLDGFMRGSGLSFGSK